MANRTNVSLKVSEARELAPKPSGVGAWAEMLREAAMSSVQEGDMKELMEGMVKRAKEGDIAAAKFVLDFIGRGQQQGGPNPKQVVVIQNQNQRGGDGIESALIDVTVPNHMEETPEDPDEVCDRCGIYKRIPKSKLCRTCGNCEKQQSEFDTGGELKRSADPSKSDPVREQLNHTKKAHANGVLGNGKKHA